MRNEEHRLQAECVKWFRANFPDIEGLFFAVPNGGARNAWTAKLMQDEGVRKGVADLVLLLPRCGFGALCIEMKSAKGRLQPEQKRFWELCQEWNIKYCVCRSFGEFQNIINNYLYD